jgi:hypothetical protein
MDFLLNEQKLEEGEYETEREPSLQGIKEKSVAYACPLHEMERRENANGQKSGQVGVPSRRLNFLQDPSCRTI